MSRLARRWRLNHVGWRWSLWLRGAWRARFVRCALCGIPSPRERLKVISVPGLSCYAYSRLLCQHTPGAHHREIAARREAALDAIAEDNRARYLERRGES